MRCRKQIDCNITDQSEWGVTRIKCIKNSVENPHGFHCGSGSRQCWESAWVSLWIRIQTVLRIRMGFTVDPDPAFLVGADPDPVPDRIRIQGFEDQKLKILQMKKNQIFKTKTFIFQILGLHEERLRYSPQKRTSSTSKCHEISCNFFHFCGSFLSFWIRIRIQPTKINADPDPQHWKKTRNENRIWYLTFSCLDLTWFLRLSPRFVSYWQSGAAEHLSSSPLWVTLCRFRATAYSVVKSQSSQLSSNLCEPNSVANSPKIRLHEVKKGMKKNSLIVAETSKIAAEKLVSEISQP